MSLIIGILLALFVFFVVVFIHEMGHFLTARWSGVKVLEFGIGIPPRLKRIFTDKKGTEWTLNWLPIGGFVRLKGEDIASPESREKDALPMAPWWKQILILIAGVTMNFLLAGFLFGVLFYQGTEPLTIHIRELVPNSLLSHVGSGTQLIAIHQTVAEAQQAGVVSLKPGVFVEPIAGSAAETAGLQAGDIVRSIDAIIMTKPEDISLAIEDKPNDVHLFHIDRAGQMFDIQVIPEDGKIGAYVAPNVSIVRYQYRFFTAMMYGMKEVCQQIGFSLRSLGAVISTSFSATATDEEKQEASQGIGGPVAIGRVFVGLADHGVQVRGVIIIMAMISLSLGVFNLLPLPALDGGRIFVILVNRIILVIAPRFKITAKVEQMIHSFGFMLLIVLSILITWKDIFLN